VSDEELINIILSKFIDITALKFERYYFSAISLIFSLSIERDFAGESLETGDPIYTVPIHF
jgi:hypothetical protein